MFFKQCLGQRAISRHNLFSFMFLSSTNPMTNAVHTTNQVAKCLDHPKIKNIRTSTQSTNGFCNLSIQSFDWLRGETKLISEKYIVKETPLNTVHIKNLPSTHHIYLKVTWPHAMGRSISFTNIYIFYSFVFTHLTHTFYSYFHVTYKL